MTAQVLNAELSTLIQESKRKNSDLRQAAEKSLNELKSLGQRSEPELAAELSQRVTFIQPFTLACGTKNAKFVSVAVLCLQRLVVSKALPRSRLKDVLDALKEAANLGVDIQLKILQALPPLLQNYASDLQGKLLGEVLLLCSILQGSKMGVVNNTAAATLQQLVISIFDEVVTEDDKALEILATQEAQSGNGTVPVRAAAFDAYTVFLDICLLTEGQKPQFLRFNSLPQTFGLELIESVLTNHSDIFIMHPEQAHILRARVVPLVVNSLSERQNFPTTVRITRVLYILLRRHLSILAPECETALNLLTHMLDPEAAPQWKRALCMEVFRGIFSEPALIRKIYAEYDAKEERKPIVKELVAALTRLATEKPAVIGLGAQSTMPIGQALPKDTSGEQAALEAGGVAGIIGGAVGLAEVTVPGLSTQWSLIRVPCIDQLDKTDPPSTPDSYIYCLTLTCINSFSEGLAKFILPLTVPGDGSKGSKRRVHRKGSGPLSKGFSVGDVDVNSPESPARTPSPSKRSGQKRTLQRRMYTPGNPLTLESHPLHPEIKLSAAIVETCWPALLASCSTFLYAALDSDLYHALVRSFQKFAHVAGILRLVTPRDAFLTTLGKAAVPSNVLSSYTITSPNQNESVNMFGSAKGLLSVDTLVGSSPSLGIERHSTAPDLQLQTLNSRNLLCLRALINLGIALGPTLETSWTIILETLQQADYIIHNSFRKSGRQGPLATVKPDTQRQNESSLMANVGPELTAVESSVGKMLESTRDFPDEDFLSVIHALCKLTEMEPDHAKYPTSGKPSATFHKRAPSISNARLFSHISENVFAVTKLGELAQANMNRIIGPNPATNGWTTLVNQLTAVASSRDLSNTVRLRAAEILNEITIAAAKSVTLEYTENVAEVQRRILLALKEVLELADKGSDGKIDSSTRSTELEIHRCGLESLNAILEHSGQSLIAGWDIVFDIITSIFHSSGKFSSQMRAISEWELPVLAKSPRLIRSSFSSLQLICSDFLSTLPTTCILVLVDTLYAFCTQVDDLNISLTTITFFWNVSDFLQTRGGSTGGFDIDAESGEELLNLVKRADAADLNAALWMFLLLRLTSVSKDKRSEVRNGSIQTLFRIFDTYGHRLGPQSWRSCLKIVVFKMMKTREAEDIDQSTPEYKLWDDTINLVLGGIGTLYSNYFDMFSQQTDFQHSWAVFVCYLEGLLSRRSYEVNTTVFKVLRSVLEKVGNPHRLDAESKNEAWRMWSSQGINLVEGLPEGSRSGVQDTLTAFVEVFKPLYAILEPTIDGPVIQRTLEILRDCVLYPDSPAYFQDIDILTPLQAAILDAMRIIRTDISGVPALMLKMLSSFSTIAYSVDNLSTSKNPKQNKPSYIALAVFSMKQMEHVSLSHIGQPGVYTDGALEQVIKSLKIPISLKYDFHPPKVGKKPLCLWRNATQTALAILYQALPAMEHLSIEDHHQGAIWEQVAALVSSVVHVTSEKQQPLATSDDDESFDIDAFVKFRGLIIPALGKTVVPEEAIAKYALNVFRASLLYEVDPGLAEVPTEVDKVGIRIVQIGKTSELELRRRRRMSYVCIDELMSLFSIKEGVSPEVTRLAKVASGYLVLRVALILSIYISDQPLRGRMPQSTVQRKELLYILQRLVTLNFSPCVATIVDSSKSLLHKSHLFHLFPLLSDAIAVAHGDQELLQWLSRTLELLSKALHG